MAEFPIKPSTTAHSTAQDSGRASPGNIRAAMSLSSVLTPPTETSEPACSPTISASGQTGAAGDTPGIVDEAAATKDASHTSSLATAKDEKTAVKTKTEDITRSDEKIENTTTSDEKAVVNTKPDDATKSDEDTEDTTMNDVDDQTQALVVEFVCMNDRVGGCNTGQVSLILSRKVISDHFGRNKSCTRMIKNWPLFCRMHYQRATYNLTSWQYRKAGLILDQFYEIEEQFPGTLYTVVLKKSEQARYNTYMHLSLAGQKRRQIETTLAPVSGKHFEAPIFALKMLADYNPDNNTIKGLKSKSTEEDEPVGEPPSAFGPNKTLENVQRILELIRLMLDSSAKQQVYSRDGEHITEEAPKKILEEDLKKEMMEKYEISPMNLSSKKGMENVNKRLEEVVMKNFDISPTDLLSNQGMKDFNKRLEEKLMRKFDFSLADLHSKEGINYFDLLLEEKMMEFALCRIEQVPSIEFLPQLDASGSPMTIPDRRPKPTPRVNNKGAVQKSTPSKRKAKA